MEKVHGVKPVSQYSAMIAAALQILKAKAAPTLGSFSTPSSLTHRVSGRSRLHRGHVRVIKKHQRRRAFYASLRK